MSNSVFSVPFFGFHTRFSDHNSVDGLIKLIEQGLAPNGINSLILEFNPGYSFKCFPEYSTGTITYEDCVKIREVCKSHGIKAFPLFQCLSHQSDQENNAKPWPLLRAHPEFCETPNIPEDAKWPEFYVHSWCASNDDIYNYIFPMMDELIEAFQTDMLHIGIDEVFEIAEECCPRCRGKNRAELLAHTVQHIHDHLAQKGVKTMMWGDRLLDANKLGYHMWEADRFGMYPAFDMTDKITRDIIITDWHYDFHDHGFPSTEQFMKGGFHTIAAFGGDESQASGFANSCLECNYIGKKLKWEGSFDGFLFTNWTPLTNETADEILGGMKGAAKGEKTFSGVNVGRTVAKIMKEYKIKMEKSFAK